MATDMATGASEQVLEFELEAEQYCVGIEHVDEIVERPDSITRLPNSPPHVEGVVDLRGRTTEILDPKVELGLDQETDGTYVIVFDFGEDSGSVGWLVDSVVQVSGVTDDDFDPNVSSTGIKGLLHQDDANGFTIWIDARQMAG